MDVVAFLSGPWAVSSPRRQTPGGGSPERAGLGRDVREKPGRWRLAASSKLAAAARRRYIRAQGEAQAGQARPGGVGLVQ